eukprot:4164595-Pleurochrysis_carterae.AAC.3
MCSYFGVSRLEKIAGCAPVAEPQRRMSTSPGSASSRATSLGLHARVDMRGVSLKVPRSRILGGRPSQRKLDVATPRRHRWPRRLGHERRHNDLNCNWVGSRYKAMET